MFSSRLRRVGQQGQKELFIAWQFLFRHDSLVLISQSDMGPVGQELRLSNRSLLGEALMPLSK